MRGGSLSTVLMINQSLDGVQPSGTWSVSQSELDELSRVAKFVD